MHPTPAELIKKWTEEKTPVLVYLVNGVKLNGLIIDFADGAHRQLVLERNGNLQIVFEHSISTILPMRITEPKN